jgi:hypothetical protein
MYRPRVRTVEGSSGQSDTELTDGKVRGTENSGQNVEDSSGQRVTEHTDGKVLSADRHWADLTEFTMRVNDRGGQILQCELLTDSGKMVECGY